MSYRDYQDFCYHHKVMFPPKLRVSFIEYLNSVPLGWGFLQGPYKDRFTILFDVPSECAQHLRSGEADIGLIPVIEYQNIPGLRILPGIAIASRRAVKSVLFVCKVPLQQVTSVSVDSSSRTSVTLLRIFLEKFHNRHSITYRVESPNTKKMLEHSDSALIIGNPALQIPRNNYLVYDLAHEWYGFTGLPFVFAFWAVRSGVELGEQAKIFYQSRELGLQKVDDIARIYSEKLQISASDIRRYIQNNLDYSLNATNLQGLQTFFDLAEELGFISTTNPLQFYPEPPLSPDLR